MNIFKRLSDWLNDLLNRRIEYLLDQMSEERREELYRYAEKLADKGEREKGKRK